MAECKGQSRGFHLTLRQQMIGVAYFAIIFTIASSLRDGAGKVQPFAAMLSAILFTPWILGFLVLFFDRPGPLKNWAVPTLFMLFCPAIALGQDWITATAYWDSGTIARPLATAVLNLFCFGSLALYWNRMGPAECPACGRVALIPLMGLWGQTRRTDNTRWCAGCSSLYWKVRNGPWKKERRKTWLDTVEIRADDSDAYPPFPGFEGAGQPAAAQALVLPVLAAPATELKDVR